MMGATLRVKNWEHFQHYRDRSPPWIKLHRAVLDDADFMRLTDAQRSHLMLIWLVAASSEGRIPDDADFLSRRLVTSSKLDLEALIAAGFLVAEPDAPRPPKAPPKPNGYRITFDGTAFIGITEADQLRWQEAYPAVIVPDVISQAAAWLTANPANRKSNVERYVVNWLKREQDRAARVKK